ncbi:MAG: ATPase [Nevskia sp.]
MKSLVCWSGGKDSAYALELALAREDLQVVGLLTTMSEEFDRISMHGVLRSLLEAQAEALQLPVEKVFIPTPPKDAVCGVGAQAAGYTVFASNDSYEARMLAAFHRAKAAGIEAIVFGDIFLEDLRVYRENLLAQAGLKAVFPLWGRDTRELVGEIIDHGIRAVVVCIDGARLGREACGRALDRRFVDALPAGVDPCGERGEYHSFVHDAPAFRHPVAFEQRDCVLRAPFWYCDLVPAATPGVPA